MVWRLCCFDTSYRIGLDKLARLNVVDERTFTVSPTVFVGLSQGVSLSWKREGILVTIQCFLEILRHNLVVKEIRVVANVPFCGFWNSDRSIVWVWFREWSLLMVRCRVKYYLLLSDGFFGSNISPSSLHLQHIRLYTQVLLRGHYCRSYLSI